MADGTYPPPHYLEPDRASALALVRDYPLASFIVADGDRPYATALPMVLADPDAASCELVAHLDANNPAAELVADGREALAVFHGPSSYISPADYTTRQLPTYNYLHVHARGRLRRVSDAEARADLYRLSRAMEPAGRWALAEDDGRVNALLPHIVGFRLVVEELTGRFKLSQDKRLADREAAWARLAGTRPAASRPNPPPSVRLSPKRADGGD